MHDFVNDDDGLIIEHKSDFVTPTLKRKRGVDLSSLRAIKREMCKVYDDSRNGRIDVQEGTRLVYQLQAVAKVQEVIEVSQRLDRLEELTLIK
jgi:hypothetical protein